MDNLNEALQEVGPFDALTGGYVVYDEGTYLNMTLKERAEIDRRLHDLYNYTEHKFNITLFKIYDARKKEMGIRIEEREKIKKIISQEIQDWSDVIRTVNDPEGILYHSVLAKINVLNKILNRVDGMRDKYD